MEGISDDVVEEVPGFPGGNNGIKINGRAHSGVDNVAADALLRDRIRVAHSVLQ